jgi:hypothetical protein
MAVGTVRGRDTIFFVLQDDSPSMARLFLIDVELAQVVVSDSGFVLSLPSSYQFVNSGPNAMSFDSISSVLYLRSLNPNREIIITIDVALAVPGHSVEVINVTPLSYTDPSRAARYFPAPQNGTLFLSYNPISPWFLNVPKRRESIMVGFRHLCPNTNQYPDSTINQISMDMTTRTMYGFGSCSDDSTNYIYQVEINGHSGNMTIIPEKRFSAPWPWALLSV